MELGDILSPIFSLVVGFVGALFRRAAGQCCLAAGTDQDRTIALRNYECSLYDMALYPKGVEEPLLGSHPEADDLEETRRAAFPYFQEFDRPEYFKLIAPHPGGGSYSATQDSIRYAVISRIIKKRLDDEKDPAIGNRFTS